MLIIDCSMMVIPAITAILFICFNLKHSERITFALISWGVGFFIIDLFEYFHLVPKQLSTFLTVNIVTGVLYFAWLDVAHDAIKSHKTHHHKLSKNPIIRTVETDFNPNYDPDSNSLSDSDEENDDSDDSDVFGNNNAVDDVFGHQKDSSDYDSDSDSDSDDDSDTGPHRERNWHIVSRISTIILVLAFLLDIGIGINSFTHVRESARSVPVKVSKSKTAPTLHRGQTPVAIAPNTVFNKVSRAMSDVPDSNYYEIATSDGSKDIQAQYYHGKPVYIVPIQFRSFFKYLKTKTIPGYFRINATDPNASPKFVHKKIKYSDSSYFSHNVERNIYRHNLDQVPMSSNAQLEINEHGTPYYVETMFRPKLLNTRPNYRRLRISVMNAETGHVTNYKKSSKTPKFIDENITSDVADSMDNYYGYYRYGWWNAQFSENGVKQPTDNGPEDGVTTVFDSHHGIHYLNDYTSTSGSSHSALGYSMINARNGKMTYYRTHGIMDTDSARDNADRNYHAQKFHAEMPVLYEIDSHPTWVMSILDDSGLQRGFYYVDGANPSIHADSASSTSCLDAFRQALVSSNSSVHNSRGIAKKTVKGIISREFVSSKNNEALIMLKGSHKVYTVSTDNYKKAALVRPGDSVSFKTGTNSTYGTATDFSDDNI